MLLVRTVKNLPTLGLPVKSPIVCCRVVCSNQRGKVRQGSSFSGTTSICKIGVLAAIVPDFDSGIGLKSLLSHYNRNVQFYVCTGIASVFALAKQYQTSSAEIINLTSK